MLFEWTTGSSAIAIPERMMDVEIFIKIRLARMGLIDGILS
jgi:hypothetical protein